jgi:hypothetical protein
VLLDAQGREIARVKRLGFVRQPLEYAVVPPAKPAPELVCDAIADVVIPFSEE